jgi:hypothetical protein
MKKITFYEKNLSKEECREYRLYEKKRITIQLRKYNDEGVYDKSSDLKNATIHIKGIKDMNKVFEIIKNALMNSKYLNDHFEIEG